jgi:hypothetical protein
MSGWQKKRFDMFEDDDGNFYVQQHCVCGSTMSSGEWMSTPNRATRACKDSYARHLAKCAKVSSLTHDSNCATKRDSVSASAKKGEIMNTTPYIIQPITQTRCPSCDRVAALNMHNRCAWCEAGRRNAAQHIERDTPKAPRGHK